METKDWALVTKAKGWVIIDLIKGRTFGHVVVALGDSHTRLAKPDWLTLSADHGHPMVWDAKKDAIRVRDARLDPRRYDVRRVDAQVAVDIQV